MSRRLAAVAWLREPTRAIAKVSLKRVTVSDMGDISMTRMKLSETKWRSKLTNVEESADELWLGVKSKRGGKPTRSS